MYALKPFLNADIKKLRTVVLVDRNHKRYPIAADFVGYSLATTLPEHVTVVLEKNEEAVYLS
jgi:pyrimidine operon attenuation protein/uracil phosphoribosyltransferase